MVNFNISVKSNLFAGILNYTSHNLDLMEKDIRKKLIILHLGPDPEFNSDAFVNDFHVQIPTSDNVFSVCQWVSAHGFPDGIICDQKLSGGDGIGFHDFWIEQFDPDHQVPFLLLDDKKDPKLDEKAIQKKIDAVYIRPVIVEALVNHILTLIHDKSLNNTSDKKTTFPTSYITPFLKRAIDIITASLILLIISPFLLIFAIAIRLESKGRVYYISKRVGSGYKLFDFYQLRTMYNSSGRRLKEITQLNQFIKEASGSHTDKNVRHHTSDPVQAMNEKNTSAFMKYEEDPRITKVGRVLIKLHFDELPQLINVIKGDLSIVGNRPLKIYDAELLLPEDLIHRMQGPAGVTGLWKLKSKRRLKRMSSEERRSLDNKYYKIAIRKFSVWSDLWIITRTIPFILRRGNR